MSGLGLVGGGKCGDKRFKAKADGYKPSVLSDLLGCPFCGAMPIIERWHGGGPLKRLISCINEDCDVSPSVTGQRPAEAIARWNHRAT